MSTIDPRALFSLVSPCEICSRRVRASHLLRYWASRPEPTVLDAEIMMVSSSGNRGIRNERSPLWATIDAPGAESVRDKTGRMLGSYFDQLERRHLAAARAAKDGAYRARYGGR
jgi:hypothetical protein